MQRLHFAEVLLPKNFSLEIQAEEAAGAEEGIKEFSVSDWRIGNLAAGDVAAFVGEFLANDCFPESASIGASQGKDHVLMAMRDRDAIVNARRGIMDGGQSFAFGRGG